MTKLRQTLRTAADLVETGLVSRHRAAEVAAVAGRYAVAISPAIAELIDASDADDPIARQFVPDIRELDRHASEREDPIGDHVKSPLTGLVHRYSDRVLLKVAAICPVYCRFCFRREMVGPDNGQPLSDADLEAALD
jgi:lysine 2,3-aminomutase